MAFWTERSNIYASRLVPMNAHVLTGLGAFRLIGKPEVIRLLPVSPSRRSRSTTLVPSCPSKPAPSRLLSTNPAVRFLRRVRFYDRRGWHSLRPSRHSSQNRGERDGTISREDH